MLTFKDIRFAYQGADEYALDGVTLSIQPGRYVALLGSNGSGKSTLVRLAGGFLLPSSGTVEVDGISTEDDERIRELRCLVGIVLQDPESQIVTSKVTSEVAFGPENLGLQRDEISQRVQEALHATGLEHKSEREPHTLSGGEKQRLVIASILAMRPDYLVLDEPTSMLDGPGRAEVQNVMRKLHESGVAILHVTHDLSECLDADEAVVLDKGRIVFDGRPDELIECGDRMEGWGLSSTPMIDLCAQLAASGMDIPKHSAHPALVAHAVAVDLKAHGPRCASAPIHPERDASTDNREAPRPAPDMAAPDRLIAEDITYEYSKGTSLSHVALRDVSLTAEPGKFILICGATGSGKSTLLRCLAGLIEPCKGQVLLNGEKVVPGKVGIAYQRPESQLFADTVNDDVAFGLQNSGLDADAVREAVREALRATELDPDVFGDRNPFTLSGGQARRAALAGILVMRPRFLLLDEPIVGLDAFGRTFVCGLMDTLRAQGTGIVVVSHDLEEFLGIADEVLLLDEGDASWQGPASLLCADPAPFARAGLEPPALLRFQTELACAPGHLSMDVDAVVRWVFEGALASGPARVPHQHHLHDDSATRMGR